jgi:hypothetical protein
MAERLPHEDEWQFETELQQYQDEVFSIFDERLGMFEWTTEDIIHTFTAAMKGTGGKKLVDAIIACHSSKAIHCSSLKELSEYMVDSMERDEMVDLWSKATQGCLLEIRGAMIDINPQAFFDSLTIAELQERAAEYYDGVKKARADGIDLNKFADDDAYTPITHQPIPIDNLWELFADDDERSKEFVDESTEDQIERDEYGQWVLDEYTSNLSDYIDGLLELCPPEKYDE